MPDYRVTFARAARKELQALDPQVALRVIQRIEGLAKEPRPSGVRKLRGADNLWRLRVGDHRGRLLRRRLRRGGRRDRGASPIRGVPMTSLFNSRQEQTTGLARASLVAAQPQGRWTDREGIAIPATVTFRQATRNDLVPIVGLLADDDLGSQREAPSEPLLRSYYRAFEQIMIDPNQHLIVAERDGLVVGTLQVSFIPYLTHRGSWRAQIEAVRVHSSLRGGGVGAEMVLWAIERARERGCNLVQLTSDKRRPDAHRFYENLGFERTHEGMKLHLEPVGDHETV